MTVNGSLPYRILHCFQQLEHYLGTQLVFFQMCIAADVDSLATCKLNKHEK